MVGTTVQAAENASRASSRVSTPTEETVLVTFIDGQGYYPKALIDKLPLYKQFVEDLGQDQAATFLLEATGITQKNFAFVVYLKDDLDKFDVPGIAYNAFIRQDGSIQDVIDLFETVRILLENQKPVYSDAATGELACLDIATCTIGYVLYKRFCENPDGTLGLMTDEQFEEMNEAWVQAISHIRLQDKSFFLHRLKNIFALVSKDKQNKKRTLVQESLPFLPLHLQAPYIRYVQRFLHSQASLDAIKSRISLPPYHSNYYYTLYNSLLCNKNASVASLKWVITMYGKELKAEKAIVFDNLFDRVVLTGDSGLVELLLKAGVDVDRQLSAGVGYGFTALMHAADTCNQEMVETLLRAKAKVNIFTEAHTSALIKALGSGDDDGVTIDRRKRIVQLLLASGANPNMQQPEWGETALVKASRFGYADIVQLLIDAGAQLNVHYKSLHRWDSWGTPLMAAAEEGHVPVVAALLAAGADKHLYDNQFMTAADHARKNNHKEVLALLEAGKKNKKCMQCAVM